MISGIDLNAKYEYTAKNDKENPTVWELGVLPYTVISAMSQSTKENNQLDMAAKMVQIGLKGWKNFGGIEFKTEKQTILGKEFDAIPESLLLRIPLNVIVELAEKLVSINKLNPDEIKN